MSSIKDKELLAFSNATNLDWQFVDLDTSKAGRTSRDVTLNTLLTPESFVRIDNEGTDREIRTPIYGEDKEKALEKMQNTAGVLMNYLEECGKNSGEGDFLKEWEVVYGADSYKVVADYLDSIKKIFNEHLSKEASITEDEKNNFLETFNYLSREEIGSRETFNKKIDLVANLIGNSVEVLGYYFTFGADKILQSTSEAIVKHLVERTGSISALFLFNGKIENIGLATNTVGNILQKDTTFNLEGTGIKFTETLDMGNTGFKVSVFKKGKNLVIAYKCKDVKNRELLPSEINYLQIIYTKMRNEHPNIEEIFFTGYNSAGDLSNLSVCLGSEKNFATSFYTEEIKEFKGFIDFTPEDFNKKYTSSLSISLVGKDMIEDSVKALIFSYIAGGMISALKGTAVFATKTNFYGWVASVLFLATKRGLDFLENKLIEREYNLLIENGYVKKEHEGIKGYIVDKILDKEKPYGTLKSINNEELKISLAFEIYLKSMRRNNKELYTLNDLIKNSTNIKEYENMLKENEESYFMTVDDISSGQLRNIRENPNIQFNELAFIKLIKDNDGIYQAVEYYEMFISRNDIGKFQFRKDERAPYFNDEQYLKIQALLTTMEIVGFLQRAYVVNRKNLNFIYVNRSKVEKSNNIPTTEIIPYEKENGDAVLNEHVFLPFIGTGGDIQDEIREDYKCN